jgi:hypothetical protein
MVSASKRQNLSNVIALNSVSIGHADTVSGKNQRASFVKKRIRVIPGRTVRGTIPTFPRYSCNRGSSREWTVRKMGHPSPQDDYDIERSPGRTFRRTALHLDKGGCWLREDAGCWGKISKRGYGVGEACPASTTSDSKIARMLQKNNHL